MSGNMTGLWASDDSRFLTDLRHPVIAAEYRRRLIEAGARYDGWLSDRQRRQFDRDMVRKYAAACPPPPRARWHLQIYDILDAAEDMAARKTGGVRDA